MGQQKQHGVLVVVYDQGPISFTDREAQIVKALKTAPDGLSGSVLCERIFGQCDTTTSANVCSLIRRVRKKLAAHALTITNRPYRITKVAKRQK